MPNAKCLLLTALAAGSFLISGCRSASGPTRAAHVQAAAKEKADEASLEERARAHAHYATAIIHDLNQDAESATQAYEQAALEDPGDESLVLEVSRRLIQAKNFERALAVVAKSAKRPEASGSIYARLGLIYAQLGRDQESLAANKTAIKKSPGALAGYQNLFVGYVQHRDEDAAWGVLSQASGQADAPPEFLMGLAELYANFGAQFPTRRGEAKEQEAKLLIRAAGTEDLNPALRLILAEQLARSGQSDQAAQIYTQILKNPPPIPGIKERVHAKLSEIYLRSENLDKAMEQLQALLKEDPINPPAHYFLGAIAMEKRKPEEAIDHFKRTLVLNPDFEQAYYDLANAQLSTDKPSEALETLEKARLKFPQTFVREFLTAAAYMRQKAYKEALQRFTAAEVVAKASDPSRLNHFFYFQLGAAYERTEDFEQAEKTFLKCLELKSDFPAALNYLGYMWAERGQNLDRAREFIEKAVKAEPDNGAYLDSLGWVLFKQGKPAEALVQIQAALKHTEEPDATLYDHLGDIQSALGQPKAAVEAWRKSVEIEDNEKVRKKIEQAGEPQ